MPGASTHLPFQTSPLVGAMSVAQFHKTAFYNSRTPPSQPPSHEYKANACMAFELCIERKDFDMPYLVVTAAADAFFAGIEEGKAIWRSAAPKIGGAA